MDHDPMDNLTNDLMRQRDKHYRDKSITRIVLLALGGLALVSILSGMLS